VNTIFGVLPVVLRRTAASWRLLSAVIAGAVIAAALMSTTSIYTDAIRDLGLAYAIRKSGPDNNNVLVRSTSQVSRPDVYQKNRGFIDSSERNYLGPLLTGQTWAGRSATFFPTPPGAAVSADEGRPRSHFQFLTGLDPHVRVVEGRMPAPTTATTAQAPQVEVALGAETARRLGIHVSDRFDAHPFWQPDIEPVHVVVVGLIEPLDQSEPYWLGLTDFFNFPSQRWDTLPFFVPEETFFGALNGYLPSMSADFWGLAYLKTSAINARNANSIRAAMETFDKVVTSNIERTAVQTKLPEVLQTFDQKLFFTRIPLLVLVLQIAGIVLYYLFMVSTMLVERQAAEIALLKSRGATTGQVMQIYAIEGMVVLVLAMAAGPPLAAGVIALMGKTPVFEDLSGGGYLAVRLSWSAYAWAFAGALLAYVTLLWPAYRATRRTVVQYKTATARPPRQPAFTRYYLDLALVGLGAVLYYQLQRRGSLVTDKIFGDQSVDPVSLLTPTFFILTVGIFFLRLFPVALRLGAWLVSRTQATAVLFGAWQLVRNPVHYSRLVLLLMLATAVGMFAASFGATLTQSYTDRAAYESGAPYRLSELRRVGAAGPNTLAASIQETYGAEVAAPAIRLSGSQGEGFQRTSFTVLGIDPDLYAQVGYFRGDFAGSSEATMLRTLASDTEATPGIDLPADARWLGMWVNPTNLNGRVAFEARVIDASGRYFTYVFGPDTGAEYEPGWAFVVADLTRPQLVPGPPYTDPRPALPLKLQALSIRFISRVSLPQGSAQFDDLQVSVAPSLPAAVPLTDRALRDPTRSFPGLPGATVLADFQSLEGWEVLNGLVADDLPDELRQAPSPGQGFAVELAWRPVKGQPQTHGLRVKGDSRPLQVFASDAFMRETHLSQGQTTRLFINGAYVDAQIAGTFHLFPTLGDTRKQPALIANVARLATWLNRNPRPSANYPDEVWLKPGPGTAAKVEADRQSGALSATVSDFEQLRLAQQKDPLIAAGWQGILFLSFAAILVLSAAGFVIYSYLTAQKRTLEFAVLRTMGFSRRQVATVVGFEQVFVIGLGMVAGSLMGLRLGSLMVKYMGLTETGDQVLPPMLLHVSWFTAGAALLVLGAVFVVTIGIVVLLYSRLALHRVLRIGEA
jgi:ABC-type multidrug transport system fused ATPase/permease subunit